MPIKPAPCLPVYAETAIQQSTIDGHDGSDACTEVWYYAAEDAEACWDFKRCWSPGDWT